MVIWMEVMVGASEFPIGSVVLPITHFPIRIDPWFLIAAG